MTPLLGFALLLGATGALRLAEAAVSWRRARMRPLAVLPEPGLFPAMVALHVGFVLLPLAEVVAWERPFAPGLAVGAGAVFLFATALRAWTLAALGRSWNVRVLPPVSVATSGPYRFLRHPNYLVVALEIGSLPLVHGAWCSALGLSLVNAAVLARRIRNEEAVLAEIPAWRDAFARRARLLPGVW
jgi:methyltransferase